MNQDYGYLIEVLEKRLNRIEGEVAQMKKSPDLSDQDWDRSTLMREWGLSPRSVANYQKQGLQHYKRGGRVYFTAKARKEFLVVKEFKSINPHASLKNKTHAKIN